METNEIMDNEVINEVSDVAAETMNSIDSKVVIGVAAAGAAAIAVGIGILAYKKGRKAKAWIDDKIEEHKEKKADKEKYVEAQILDDAKLENGAE